jgi:hypothetical protein
MSKNQKKAGPAVRLLAEKARAERAMIDEYGELSRAMAPHRPAMARLAALASGIRARFHGREATEEIEAPGDYYTVVLGPCGLQTRIEDMQAAYDALGHDAFIAHCSITLERLRLACGSMNIPFTNLTVQQQTGPRPLTVHGQDALDRAA